MTNRLEIRTPEGVRFSLPLAGPISRFVAWAIDLAALAAAGSLLGSSLVVLGALSADLAQAFFMLAYFVVTIGYGILLEWGWRGQTLGKRVMRLRVIDELGLRLTLPQVVLRNLLRAVDSIPLFYLVGGVAMVSSRLGQRLGDYAAGTVVVRSQPRSLSLPEGGLSVAFNSLADHPHLVARLRQRVDPEAASLGLRALLRRDELEPPARLEVFRALADAYREVVEFPQAATENLTDEAYVRNVVALVFGG